MKKKRDELNMRFKDIKVGRHYKYHFDGGNYVGYVYFKCVSKCEEAFGIEVISDEAFPKFSSKEFTMWGMGQHILFHKDDVDVEDMYKASEDEIMSRLI